MDKCFCYLFTRGASREKMIFTIVFVIFILEPRHEKKGFCIMRKERHRLA